MLKKRKKKDEGIHKTTYHGGSQPKLWAQGDLGSNLALPDHTLSCGQIKIEDTGLNRNLRNPEPNQGQKELAAT